MASTQHQQTQHQRKNISLHQEGCGIGRAICAKRESRNKRATRLVLRNKDKDAKTKTHTEQEQITNTNSQVAEVDGLRWLLSMRSSVTASFDTLRWLYQLLSLKVTLSLLGDLVGASSSSFVVGKSLKLALSLLGDLVGASTSSFVVGNSSGHELRRRWP